MIRQQHHLIANILHYLAGGGLGLVMAGLAVQFGMRSADRMPGESRRPECLYCLRRLSWREIFPLFGWLLRPDTHTLPCPCGERTKQWAQPTTEVTGFALGALAMYWGGWNPAALPLCLGIGLLPAIAMIDLHFGIIPDELNALIGLFGLWWALTAGDVYVALIVAATLLAVGLFGALIYSRWRGKEMLGLGDVKFLAAAGLWLQPDMAPWFLSLAGFSGAGIGIIWQRISGNKESPFAPALCLSLALCILYQLGHT